MGLIDEVFGDITDQPVDEIRIGDTFVGVRVGSRIGVAHRVDIEYNHFNKINNSEPSRLIDLEKLIGTRVANLVYSNNLLKATIGTAAINAQLTPKDYHKGNIFTKILEMAPKDMRGDFCATLCSA